MSEDKKGRLAKAAGKFSGVGKAAIKQKAAGVIADAAKPVTDSIKKKVIEAKQSAKDAVEKKGTEIVKEQMKKEAKKKFLGR
jgi:F0F1-type ATP synthase epsilon subunit|tara:strand:+ start:1443 stop:1688 length:246 start_codon:yes stop_codon:yes gene_type:complete